MALCGFRRTNKRKSLGSGNPELRDVLREEQIRGPPSIGSRVTISLANPNAEASHDPTSLHGLGLPYECSNPANMELSDQHSSYVSH